MLEIELVYVTVDKKVVHYDLKLPDGATVETALFTSGIVQQYPEVNHYALGVFSRPVTRDSILQSGDRVEIYRPLLIDPKEKRRSRAK